MLLGLRNDRILLVAPLRALTKNYDLLLRFRVLPAAKYQQVRADCCACVAKPAYWWIANILSTLPGHGVSGPDHEVVA